MSCVNCDCPFFELQAASSPLSDADVRCLVTDAVQSVTFKCGEALFMQGQVSSNLYSLASGTVKICTHTPDGREQIVGLSSPGNLLVGLQSISDERYAYSAIASTSVQACKINHRTLFGRLRDKPELAIRLIRAMNSQLAHSRALMEVLGHKCAAAKIASFILLMTPKAEHGNCRFSLPFSRAEVASLLGLTEETVCRLMANMKREGTIYAPRGKVEIRDWQQLQAIAEGSGGHLAA